MASYVPPSPEQDFTAGRDPALQFPFELFSDILLLSIDEDLSVETTIERPLALSQVSQNWRSVSLSTPRLWSRLYLTISRSTATRYPSLVETWLTRSVSCPLHVELHMAHWQDEKISSMSHSILQAIVQHSDRWQRIVLSLPSTALASLVPIKGRLAILAELSLRSRDFPRSALDIFETAPMLRSFESFHFSPLDLSLPWAQLSTIIAASISIPQCLEMQRRCPRLQKGAFFLTDSSSQELDIDIRSLFRSITLSPHSVDINPLLERCTYPQLVYLQIHDLQVSSRTQLPSFLARSPNLQSLKLNQVALSSSDLVACLQSVPNLVTLELVEYRSGNLFTRDFLVAMMFSPQRQSDAGDGDTDHAVSNSSNYLVPHLEHLKISASPIDSPIDSVVLLGPFLTMVESRCGLGTGTQLTSAHLRLENLNAVYEDLGLERAQDVQKRILKLQHEGVDVTLGNHSLGV
ncbi:hypothetical protein D9758_011060 [Tetrapyrgos nigripes]|uniref:F-box domain-containing protein n=1 Tax=Tetrapyrgos nigripes TaxID=182062 RepID=A0A8H5CT68_9AGAR|nr:hypothetical protein D9758_011060 [Tetrapyrgos nigripes]